MPKLYDIKFPSGCKTLPEGFWSSVDVWIKKPHVINKRLCGVKETEGENVGKEALKFLLDDSESSTNALSFITGNISQTEEHKKPWRFSVRTIIPKVNCYGIKSHKEVILKDNGKHQVTFLPFEEDPGGQVCLKKSNIYQILLVHRDSEEWALELHMLAPDAWFSDGVAYPKPAWFSTDLLPKLVRWAAENKSSEFSNTLSLLPVEKYSVVYQQLKDKYKAMVKVWPEVTDPEKFVYEDVAIATYLLVLWAEERARKGLTLRQTFVDLGCGNGLLVHILTNEGHSGKGIDVRRRKIWDMYGPQTVLEEKAITPSDSFLFPGTDWLIGNHSDELTPWISVIAARSSYTCQFFVLPCCFYDFYGKYQRRQCKKSQYREYIDFITEVSHISGFKTDEDCLRIPSTKRVCLLGTSRNYQLPDEAEVERQRAEYIQTRRSVPGLTGQRSDMRNDSECCLASGDLHRSAWGSGFQPRERVETVRNCAALPRDLVDGVVLRVASSLLEMTEDDGGGVTGDWNRGAQPLCQRDLCDNFELCPFVSLFLPCEAHLTRRTHSCAAPAHIHACIINEIRNPAMIKTQRQDVRAEIKGSLSVSEVAGLLEPQTLQLLKKECGGLQTLLKNNHQVFRVEGGRVFIRDWRDQKPSRADAKRKPVAPGALKTRPCWFFDHHPQRCPLQAQDCAFAHGPADLRPSTRPLLNKMNKS